MSNQNQTVPEVLLIMMAGNALSRNLHKRLLEPRITSWQMDLMTVLWMEGDLSQKDLTEFLGVSKASVQKALGFLLIEGLVQKVPNPLDARSRLIRVTTTGQKLRQEVLGHLEPKGTDGIDAEFAEGLLTQLRSLS